MFQFVIRNGYFDGYEEDDDGKEEPVAGVEPVDLTPLIEELCLPVLYQDQLNALILPELFRGDGEPVCDRVYHLVRFERGIKIGYQTLQDRVGTQRRGFLDGTAMLEWAALKLMNERERATFAHRTTFKWRMHIAYKALIRLKAVTVFYEIVGKRKKRWYLLKPDVWKLITA